MGDLPRHSQLLTSLENAVAAPQMCYGRVAMDTGNLREEHDVLLYESPSGINAASGHVATTDTALPAHPPRVLYVISLFNVYNSKGEKIDGDALVVRPPHQPERTILASVLDCDETELPGLLERGGTWAVRQIESIDGYRLIFDPS